MAKGRDKHDAYLEALQLLGRDLARRARSKCELTGESGSLITYDLEGPKVEPDLDHVLLISSRVKEHLEGNGLDGPGLHYLETAIWSELPAIRGAAIRILEQIDEPWAKDAIDNAAMMEPSDDPEW